jgi:hypothetical protein
MRTTFAFGSALAAAGIADPTAAARAVPAAPRKKSRLVITLSSIQKLS